MVEAKKLFPSLMLVAALLTYAAQARSVGWSLDVEAEATVLRFSHAGGEPMTFADVVVTAPDGQIWQRGQADREGRFAVVLPPVPFPDGAWTVDVVGSAGEALTATVTPRSAERASEMRTSATSLIGWIAIVTSLLCMIFGGMLIEQRGPAARGKS